MSRPGRGHPRDSGESAEDKAQHNEARPPQAVATAEPAARPLRPGRVRVRALRTTTGEGMLQHKGDEFTLNAEHAKKLAERGEVELI